MNRNMDIFDALVKLMNDDDLVIASYNEISKKSGYCRTVVIQTVRELELIGKIEKDKNTSGGKNLYKIVGK